MSKLSIIEGDENYVATIVNLPELKKVEGLDNLMVATVFGYNCLVWKDSNPDVMYVFFPAECELSKKFLQLNNLYRHSELNEDKTIKGFFDDNGRVRAVKFKGVVSSGFIIPVDSLGHVVWFWDAYSLQGWETFHIMEGIEICKKYRNPETLRRIAHDAKLWIKKPKYDRVIPTQFRLHQSTPQFLRFIGDFKEWDRVVITEKLHGTSGVFSNVLTLKPQSFIEKILWRLWVRIERYEYFPLYSSRTVIKNESINPNQDGGYYWEDVWWQYAKLLEWRIEKWITLYWEIVGYTAWGQQIQKGYTYGCEKWESKFYVYRITSTTPDGIVIEFTDGQIRQYCKIREIDVVPLVNLNLTWWDKMYWESWIRNNLIEQIEVMCPLNDGKVPREGVVIRRDGQETFSAYKLKSQLFLGYETKQLDEGVPDTEENS